MGGAPFFLWCCSVTQLPPRLRAALSSRPCHATIEAFFEGANRSSDVAEWSELLGPTQRTYWQWFGNRCAWSGGAFFGRSPPEENL